ncbi:MAG: SDR family NAD(P)-dependent oxidoreductase [Pseudomonadota bacterium]
MNRRQFLNLSAVAASTPLLSACIGEPEGFPVEFKPGYPNSGFDAKSTAELVTEGIDLSGKTVLITGCNSGMGLETMRVLAMRGAHVIGTGRTLEKATKACDSVEGRTTPVVLELSNFDSVVECANTMLDLESPIDVLICNAGMSAREERTVVNGIEMTFLVNYLSHFLLVNKLMPSVQASKQARIVHVASRSAYSQAPQGGIRFDSLGEAAPGGEYNPWDYYGQSKLANALFSHQLAKKYANTNITSNALHPGVVQTNIARGQGRVMETVFGIVGPLVAKTVEEGAATACYAATHPNMEKVNGQFLFDSNVVTIGGEHHLQDDALAARLWEYSEQKLSEYLA